MNIRTVPCLVVAAATLAVLAGCSSPAAAPPPNSAANAPIDSLTFTDSWAKASDKKMTAVFGVLKNASDKDITIASVTTAVSPVVELHETVPSETGEKVMRKAEKGFTVPAHGSLELVPGDNHIMLMSLTGPVKEGDSVSLTITLDDGATRDFVAPAKAFAGANENYKSKTAPAS